MTPREQFDAVVTRRWPLGDHVDAIGEELGVQGATVQKRALQLGLPSRKPPSKWTDDLVEHVRRGYCEEVLSYDQIAARSAGRATSQEVKRLIANRKWVRPDGASRTASDHNIARSIEATLRAGPARLECAPLPPVHPPGPHSVTMADHPGSKRGACIFPVGPTDPNRADLQLFCGEPIPKGATYCPHHTEAAVYRQRKSK